MIETLRLIFFTTLSPVLLSVLLQVPAHADSTTHDARLIAADVEKMRDVNLFGSSVALVGDTVLIGSNLDSEVDNYAGAAYVFTRTDGVWKEHQKILPPDAASFQRFGYSVALDEDTALIGRKDLYGFGAAYVFTRTDGIWTLQQKLLPAKVKTPDFFGTSVALEGDTAFIGAYADDEKGRNSGAAYVFTRADGVWTQQQKLMASEGVNSGFFGRSIALDQDTALISRYVFTRNEGVWSQQQELQSADKALNNNDLSIALHGDTALVSDYVFTRTDGIWREQQKLVSPEAISGNYAVHSLAFDGTTALIKILGDDDDNGPAIESVQMFSRSNDKWMLSKTLEADGTTSNIFGTPVALDGDVAMIGAPEHHDEQFGHVVGSVYVFNISNDGIDGDGDGDAIIDTLDNCPAAFNHLQEDFDDDRIGDVCDTDDDNDTIADVDDNCPLTVNPEQANSDKDSAGDACDKDDDDVPDNQVAESLDSIKVKSSAVAADDVTVEINQAPSVTLGSDLEVLQTDALTLKGQVKDDGLPQSPGMTSVEWRTVSGPGTVDFDDPASATTAMSFSANGRYELELRASDGALFGVDQILITVTGNTSEQIVERRVASSNDDAEEALTSTGGAGPIELDSIDLELASESTPQLVGLRFTNLPIPPGATVTRAWVQFTVDQARPYRMINLAIRADKTADAGSFDASFGNLSSRPRTTSTVDWSPPAWARVDEAGDAQRTPDLSAIVQEIVAGDDWQSGNALVLLLDGTGQRIATSFDGESNSAPLLRVEYQ